jgi:NTP pyrophosphatase (non-canonical NTP hydrolase)
MENLISLSKYQDFVEAVTSEESNNFDTFTTRCKMLNESDSLNVNISLLITACFGLAAESGEFSEIPKKILFQGKPLTKDNIFHMKRELGDIMFYWVNACRALNLDPNDVIQENVTKLSARYPNGFEVARSEKREIGDI